MKGNTASRSALFSKTIFNTCLLKESSISSASMDRFLKSPKHNFVHEFTTLGNAVCVLGKSGIGKTWTVHQALDPCIELTSDVLKSRQDTLDFLEKIRNTETPVILDEYESLCDLMGVREIKEPPTKGLFVVISQIPVKFDFKIETYEFPVPSFETIKRLVPKASDDVIRKSKGDLRFVFRSLVMASDAPDEFQAPKDLILSLVDSKSKVNPASCIGVPLAEPGNMVSIIHENYIDTKNANNEFFADVSNYLSESALFESKIYDGNWDLFPYYGFLGCIQPAVEIRHRLTSDLRPGSIWTKHQNMCMRSKRINTMATRVPGIKLSYDALCLLKTYAENQNIDILHEYKIQPQDVDVLNYLSPYTKIKPRVVSTIKKCLTER